MKLTLLRGFLTLLILFCLLAYVAGSLTSLAADEKLMLDKLMRFSFTQSLASPQDDLAVIAETITGYLSGKRDSAQPVLDEGSAVFSEHELLHLEDIRGLVSMGNVLRYAALAILGLMAIVAIAMRNQSELLKSMNPVAVIRLSAVLFLAFALLLMLWGRRNFESLFFAFHRLLFRNELWLLDPRTDLLLQLMPGPFFVSYGVELLKRQGFLFLMLLLTLIGLRPGRQRTKVNHEG